jgi:hypothetical protein
MQADNFINGGDPGIDELLKQSFLDLDQSNPVNDQLFDMTSQNVFETEWPGQIDPQKETQLTNTAKITKWPWILSGIAGVGVIATVSVLLLTDKTNNTTNPVQDNSTNVSTKLHKIPR